MSKTIRWFTVAAATAAAVLFSILTYYTAVLPDTFSVKSREHFALSTALAVQTESSADMAAVANNQTTPMQTRLTLFGVIPIKTVALHTVEETTLIPCGTPFGIKMYTKGVVVVGVSQIQSGQQMVCPAQQAWLQVGDVILKVNGQVVNSNERVSQMFNASRGQVQTLIVDRKGKRLAIELAPVKSDIDQKYKVGVWVRDSSAGIGTITFYDPASGLFGGLGHPICDVDTGEIMPLGSGEIVPVEINHVVKGAAGAPGELQGTFAQGAPIGQVHTNNEQGIFGTLNQSPVATKGLPVALKHEVQKGAATIVSTVSGSLPNVYTAEIEKISYAATTSTKNMVIRITDPALIQATGGIVQGMSGSPIIQNGKLVGAITHVFVNDPTRGYGIFIENMLEAAE